MRREQESWGPMEPDRWERTHEKGTRKSEVKGFHTDIESLLKMCHVPREIESRFTKGFTLSLTEKKL